MGRLVRMIKRFPYWSFGEDNQKISHIGRLMRMIRKLSGTRAARLIETAWNLIPGRGNQKVRGKRKN